MKLKLAPVNTGENVLAARLAMWHISYEDGQPCGVVKPELAAWIVAMADAHSQNWAQCNVTTRLQFGPALTEPCEIEI